MTIATGGGGAEGVLGRGSAAVWVGRRTHVDRNILSEKNKNKKLPSLAKRLGSPRCCRHHNRELTCSGQADSYW